MFIHSRKRYPSLDVNLKTGVCANTWIKEKVLTESVRDPEMDLLDITTIRMMVQDEGEHLERSMNDFSYPFRHLTTGLLRHDLRVLRYILEIMRSVGSSLPFINNVFP